MEGRIERMDEMSRRERALLERPLEATGAHLDTMQIIFRRAIAAILGSLGVRTDADAYEYVALLAEAYLLETAAELQRLARVQRRALPALADVALLLQRERLRLHDLERHKGVRSRFTAALDGLRFSPEEEPVPEGARVFFAEATATKSLVPPTKRLDAVPPWMPEFPPDHTFMATPQYARRITDPRQLREKVVEEGRLAEAALRRLTGIVKVDEALAAEEEEDAAEDDELVEVRFDSPKSESAPGDHSESESSDDDMKLDRFTAFRPAAANGGASAPLSPTAPREEPREEPRPKPRLSLKLTLSKEPKITVVAKDERTTTMTNAERNKYDPFGIRTTSKRFDVAAYARKQLEIRDRREAKRQRLNEERQEAVANALPRQAASSQHMVDREYNAAFAALQRNSDAKVLDTGVINWDKVRYVL